MRANIEWYGSNARMSLIVPWYVPSRKRRYEIEEVPVPLSYHAVRHRPQRQSLKLSFWERTVPPHLLGVRSGTVGAQLRGLWCSIHTTATAKHSALAARAVAVDAGNDAHRYLTSLAALRRIHGLAAAFSGYQNRSRTLPKAFRINELRFSDGLTSASRQHARFVGRYYTEQLVPLPRARTGLDHPFQRGLSRDPYPRHRHGKNTSLDAGSWLVRAPFGPALRK
jgi:hypothetical protein